ncbi:magnesium transporter CorA family protein [Porticoccaceae bacterium LTM1]|nr:magnesium transporter CorA family protein [Porticoccaceae bacterium LTM1]
MIRTVWLDEAGVAHRGAEELIDRWRQQPASKLWLDLEGEEQKREEALLLSLGCHEIAVSQAQIERRPPKIEEFKNHTLIVYRGIAEVKPNLNIQPLDISLFIGDRILITRHVKRSYSVDQWIGSEETPELLENPAELGVQIVRGSLGVYLENLLAFEEKLQDLEEEIQAGGDDEMLREMVLYKSRLRRLNRIFAYHERIIGQLNSLTLSHIDRKNDDVRHAIRALYDRCERLQTQGQMFYEICGDLIEGYISVTSHQLNQTMKILTVITAVFVPLGFLAGVYGMNFDNMPELHYGNSYFVLIGVMLTIAVTLVTIFKRKGWLS